MMAWVLNGRWASHADMAIEYAECIRRNLSRRNVSIDAVHMDIWSSLNGRMSQRVVDPRVNLLGAPWSPWEAVPWVMPLLEEFASWRPVARGFRDRLKEVAPQMEVLFLADFPGLSLELYIPEDLGDVSLWLLSGRMEARVRSDSEVCDPEGGGADAFVWDVGPDSPVWFPPGSVVSLETVSDRPSLFMFLVDTVPSDNFTVFD
ncbi:unnamed protein product [Darwinula stevensoni]|uniref:Vitamin K-dependent gamma-carboxylase lumenal domain-containing protein n=1 Tax=Darwinula stevensoni TaxID=69355 RepID=A0A7R8XL31_9CRUS|nr:unnamed protein product [Darwinula stevensoni]CAG0895883.1 unnamed protein product [Darwinula stevensoni]